MSRTSRMHRWVLVGAGLVSLLATGCAGGVPVRLRIDEFTMDFSIDEALGTAFDDLISTGLLPSETGALPELWPASMPRVQYGAVFNSPPVPVDLTPEPGSADFEKYEQINKAADAVVRIELNRLVLRVEQSSLSVGLPELRLQVADEADANPLHRLAWRTIAVAPATEPGFVGDSEFEFVPSGETFFNSQLSDERKEFAIRVQGKVELDTDENPRLPSGAAKLRLIVVATFFVAPENAIDAAGDLAGGT